uniref:EF-hand domain-containing protein n=1 Tax=Salix viminalis TaxID=40686 RepID=A0A6N2MG35_SALVM
MSVEILDGATIVNFLEDEDAFNVSFDHDLNGTVDLEEFKAETRQMMLAMANGMGFLPVQMVLEEDSFLKKAVEWESASCLLHIRRVWLLNFVFAPSFSPNVFLV